MEECIFCKIVEGSAASHKVYEDDLAFAFTSIEPLNPGHVLVVPKKHYRWVWDMPNIGEFYDSVGKVANGIRKAMDTEWVVSLVFGEEVPHAHVWLVPRFENDGHGGSIDLKNVKEISDEETQEIVKKIQKEIK